MFSLLWLCAHAAPLSPALAALQGSTPSLDTWRALLAHDCDTQALWIRTPFEARVIRNAAFAAVGYTFKSEALRHFYAAEGWYTPTGTPALTDPAQKACAETLVTLERKLQRTVPMSPDLMDRLLWTPEPFRTFREWSFGSTNPWGPTQEHHHGQQLFWISTDPDCPKGQEDCAAYTVNCDDPRVCLLTAAG